MNVTFLLPHSLKNYGGGEKWIISVGNLLVQNGNSVEVLALGFSPSGSYRIDDKSISDIINFSYRELRFSKGKFYPLRIKSKVNINSDLLYVTGGYFFFLREVLDFKTKKIYGFHDPALQEPKNFLQKRIMNNLLPRFDLIHTLNDLQTKIVKNKAKVFQLANTYFGESPKCGKKFEKFTILFFGQHEIHKGIDVVISIMKQLPPDIEMIVLGSGSVDLGKISKENIKVKGFASEEELSTTLCKVHAVLFPSRSEASSLVAIESIAHGTPVVYRNIPVNKMLSNKPLCASVESDSGFLDQIIRLRNEYLNDPDNYIQQCKILPHTLMTPDEYISNFTKMLKLA